jgi:hypothetical protein
VTVLMLSGCANPLTGEKPPPAPPTSTAATKPAVCGVWKPILFSRLHDTAETIDQAKANNAARDAYCSAPR